MTAQVIPLPLAVRVGCTHVAVAQAYSGKWVVALWSANAGPTILGEPTSYQQAALRARSYARRHGCILELPEGRGSIHVLRRDRTDFDVLHESASDESFATLRTFGPHERDRAVEFALRQLGQYAPCRLGRVEE